MTNFADMVTIGEHVKSGLKSGKITDTTAQQTTNKKSHGGFAKKKEGEANAITTRALPRYQFSMAPMPYYPDPYVATAQYQQPPFQYQPQKGNQQSTPAQKNPNQQYNRAIVPKELPATTPPFHAKHDPNASCAYHAGFIGYSTEDCWALKYKIQDLINQDILTFSEEKPNVKTNPLPNNCGAAVSAVIGEENTKFILRAEEVKTSMSVVLQKLEQFGFLEGVHDDCTVCKFDPDYCDRLKGCMQELMDQGLIRFSKSQVADEVAVIEPITIVYRKKKVEAPPRRIQPIHFRIPTPSPYQNTKAVPWNYETTTYLGGKEICIPDTKIVDITGTGGMTRSGRVFAPKYTHRVSPAPTVISPKEKVTPMSTPQSGETVLVTPTMTIAPVLTKIIDNNKAVEAEASKGKGPMVEKEQLEDHKKSITFEESHESLKLIKKSDFKIID
ncbi:uncharacterized protein LOC127080324 [Lathyrus oleraceus]|uniref:uncharacterized protein LOC127080324 n=1 Tax=Pisum sativum TaxID=3888 RepID=UPI0021CF6DD2|nr:uncharacterized protein LOC127080324 [Pisum sativum]